MDMLKKVAQNEVQTRTLGPPHWQDGICSCCDDTGICCQTIWCFPCTTSNMLNKLEAGVGTCDCFSCFCVTMITYATGNRYPIALAQAFRRELVQRYGIREENQCSSCLLGQFCWPCVFCQVQREMGKRQQHAGGCCAKAPDNQPSMQDKVMNLAGKAAGAIVNNGPQAPKMWSSGLCDCTCAECCEGIFCPCCIFGYMGSRLDTERVTTAKAAGSMDPISCCGFLWNPESWAFANRREVIERYNIVGESHIMSACKILCCPFCTVLQQRREMGFNGEWPGGLCVKEAPAKKEAGKA